MVFQRSVTVLFLSLWSVATPGAAFVSIQEGGIHTSIRSKAPPLTIAQASLASRQYTRGDRRGGRGNDRSKRQERVGQLVKTELSRILHTGIIRGNAEYLDDDLRQRISVVSADVSPDLKQARISVSIRGPNKPRASNDDPAGFEEDSTYNPDVDKRRAYAWLVRNTKPLRHSLAQKMSHMKSCPNLSFAQVDVAAATDVMYLIDKVASGYKRERVGGYNENDMPTGIVSGIDFDEDFEDEEWDDEDGGEFFSA